MINSEEECGGRMMNEEPKLDPTNPPIDASGIKPDLLK
jgi:hypothetical protein